MYFLSAVAGRWLVVSLLLVAWWLRLTIYSSVELGQDGLSSIGVAALPFGALIDFSLTDNHPPLYFLLIRGWLDLVGWTFTTARFPSIVLGILLIALVTGVVRRTSSRPVALATLVLLIVSPPLLTQSATTRDYILGITLAAASWAVLIASPASPRKRWLRLAGLALITFAGLMTWYFHAITIVAQGIYAIRRRSDLLAIAAGTVAAAPWVLIVILGWSSRFTSVRDTVIHPSPLGVPFDLAAAGESLVGSELMPGLLVLAWVGLAIFGLMRLGRSIGTLAAGVGLIAGLISAILITINWGGADVVPRYFMSAAFYGVPLVAVGAMGLRWPLLRVAAIGSLALAGLLSYSGTVQIAGNGGQRAELARSTLRTLSPNDRLIFDNMEDAAFTSLLAGSTSQVQSMHSYGASTWYDRRVDEVAAFGLANPAGRTKLVQHVDNLSVDVIALESRLARDRLPLFQMENGRWLISTFNGDSRWHTTNELFGDLRLAGVNIADSIPACGKVGIGLMWTANRTVQRDYTLSVNLVDERGERVGQTDSPPAGAGWPTSRWKEGDIATTSRFIDVPTYISAGNYRVLVSLYDEDDNLLKNTRGQDRVDVGGITIMPCGSTSASG